MKQIVAIPVAAIDSQGRVRPVIPAVAERYAEDIRERGQRQPIEVAPAGKGKWRLVDGAQRLAAVKLLHAETIEAIEVEGNRAELDRDELLAQLMHADLTKLERAQFLAKFKKIHQEMYPETRAGGDRRSAGATKSRIPAFDQIVVARGPWSLTVIKDSTFIGEHLATGPASRLRGTRFEDNQSDLMALAKLSPEIQAKVAELLTAGKDAAPSVAEAIAIVKGHAPAGSKTHTERLVARWRRMKKTDRRAWVMELTDEQAEELAELLDERSGQTEENA